MKITLLVTGSLSPAIEESVSKYSERINHYSDFKITATSPVKALRDIEIIKRNEEKILLERLDENDYVILLDSLGRQLTSVEFAQKISGFQLQSRKSVVFVIGGAYGFGKKMYERTNELMALSKMTLQHDIALLVFIEQLYRAFTIIRGEKYHH